MVQPIQSLFGIKHTCVSTPKMPRPCECMMHSKPATAWVVVSFVVVLLSVVGFYEYERMDGVKFAGER